MRTHVVYGVEVPGDRGFRPRLCQRWNDPGKFSCSPARCTEEREHDQGAQWLIHLGGIDFFSQLRPNLQPNLQLIVDSILDRLFHLQMDLPNSSLDLPHQIQFWPLQDFGVMQEEVVADGYFKETLTLAESSANPEETSARHCTATCLKFSTFPWLPLTTTDKHVLSTNESSLRSNNHNLIWRSCQLLQDVIMQDFPAEIFLQRPKIVQSLLSLLKLASEKNGTQHLALQSVSCLFQLCNLLKRRLHFHRDSSFLCTKQDVQRTYDSQNPSPVNVNVRPLAVGRTSQRLRGDGQDWDAASSSGNSNQALGILRSSPMDTDRLEFTDIENEDNLELQFQQLNLPQFCVLVLENATPLLKSDRKKQIMQILEMLRENLILLSESVSENVWEDESLTGRELRNRLLTILDTLGDAILYHKNNNSSEQSSSSVVSHRMAFISISLFSMHLLQTVLPVEKASDVLPGSMINALFLLSLDLPFRMAYTSIHETVIAFMEQLNSEDYAIYKQSSETAYSIECATSFMLYSKKEGTEVFLELLELAEKALSSLPFHKHLPLVQKCIGICSEIYKFEQSGPVLREESQKVLLSVMSHWMPLVKAEAYKCSLEIVKEYLGIQNVTKPVSSVCQGIHFLLQQKVLYEISSFGLQDSNNEICIHAKTILTYLLKGRLVMTDLTWNTFIEAVYPVIPVLQGFADTEDVLGASILTLCETLPNGDSVLPKTTAFRAALRQLFSKKKTIRSLAIKWLAVHLMNEDESSCKRPSLQGSILSDAVSIFIIEQPIDLKLDENEKAIFKEDTVEKVSEIFTSETLDITLKKSAAEQMAVMAQNIKMHSILKRLGVVDKLLHYLHKSVYQYGKEIECIIMPCLVLLRKLLYADPALRLCLAQNYGFLLALFRVCILFQQDVTVRTETTAVLFMLLFDEISRMNAWSESISLCIPSSFGLPITVMRRFYLPVQVNAYHAVSPYTMSSSLSLEWLSSKPVSVMLRMAWNISWHQGIDHFLSKNEHDDANFLDTLKLSPEEVLTLKITHSASGLQECLSSIIQAVSHGEVRAAVAKMNFYLLNDRLVLNYITAYNMSSLNCLPWHTALGRFLLVHPACEEDEKLLSDVISFLNKILQEQKKFSDSHDLQWILEMLLKQSPSPLFDLMENKEDPTSGHLNNTRTAVRQHLQKELMIFFNTLMLCLTSVTDRKVLVIGGNFRTLLAFQLLQHLKVADAPHFYGLPSLARTLRGMSHVTSQPGWTSYCPSEKAFEMCVKSLTSLLEIISSFYVEWGGNAFPIWGKCGVTKRQYFFPSQDWMHHWFLPYDHGIEEQVLPRMGLEWLIPLWGDRDPEVRFTSLGIGSALTTLREGCLALSASCQNISGGLWGTLLSIFLDPYECSLVRREAAFVLQNLLVVPIPENQEDSSNFDFQGPSVQDEESGQTLVGRAALQALLHHFHFYEHVGQMAKNCHFDHFTFGCTGFMSKVTEENLTGSEDSIYIWQSVHNHTSSESTLSTLIPTGSTVSSENLLSISTPLLSDNDDDKMLNQGQINNSRTPSISTEVTGEPVYIPSHLSVVTPCLLSATCSLLENLLAVNPKETAKELSDGNILISLARLLKPDLIERFFCDLKDPVIAQGQEKIKTQVIALYQYLSTLSGLAKACLLVDVNVITQDEIINTLLMVIFSALSIKYKKTWDTEIQYAIYQTWTDMFTFLAILLRKNGHMFLQLESVLAKHRNTLHDALADCLNLASSNPRLCTASMHFLSILLAEQGKHKVKERRSPVITSFLDGNENMGYSLCKLLLQSLEEKAADDPLRQVCTSALIILLAVSRTSQKYCLKANLIESCIEDMKNIHAQLNLDHLKQFKVTLQILRNCLYQNEEGKAVALESKFPFVLHSLWPWLLMDDLLMQSALQLLCVYTANFPAACTSLCWTNTGMTSIQPCPKTPMNNSLIYSILKIASDPASSNSSIQQIAFALLSNLVIIQDCRSIIQKSNFLQHFLSVSLPKSGSKSLCVLASNWLKFLWNLSMESDGQQIILKLKGILDLLLEMTKFKQKMNSVVVLLILHNACFNTTNKAKILSNDKAVAMLSTILESDSVVEQRIGASALWALLHNYQKVNLEVQKMSPGVKIMRNVAKLIAST
ncbi:hypothetical protein GDO86_011157 [Hymenochirus boettgeri]|uniref:Rotatin n=1 Tax=Hymenochirus boettgeri TaxID=247094 RepID=A0A8T2JAL6_9PIPI|nr:hypothetical protein GDO86_011157 [Hymenochirus boettgeri]